jgi:hypothetical protein
MCKLFKSISSLNNLSLETLSIIDSNNAGLYGYFKPLYSLLPSGAFLLIFFKNFSHSKVLVMLINYTTIVVFLKINNFVFFSI